MARGFGSGVFLGGVLGVSALALASLLGPLPQAPVVGDAAPDVASAPARVTQATSGENPSPVARAPVTAQVAPQSAAPESDDNPGLDDDALRAAVQPQTGQAGALAAPAEAVETTDVSVAAEAPVIPNPQALAPMQPEPEESLAINTSPAAPPPPSKEKIAGSFDAPAQPAAAEAHDAGQTAITALSTETTVSALAPQAPAAPTAAGSTQDLADSTHSAPQAQATQVASLAQGVAALSVGQPVGVATASDVQDAPTQAPVILAPTKEASDPLPEVSEESAVAQVAAPEASDQTVAQDEGSAESSANAGQTRVAQSGVDQADTEENVADEAEQAAPKPVQTAAVVRRGIGTPAISLTDRNTGVTINRPGGQAGQAVEATEAAQEETATAAAQTADNEDLPAIKRHAQAFENTDGKPLMSIVLIDDGTSAVAGADGVAALRSFPYPLSFAVDTSLNDAADRMAIYRAEGLEVLAMVDLPEGALPTDAETALSVILPRMDEVVAVLEGTNGGLQGSRDVSDQVTAILAQSGHGLLTQDKGLNTMPKLAVKEGVPAAPIFRDFDSKGQDARVIRRFLDQAAFRAGQEGAVVMLGRLRPDTVSALLLWGLQDRAGTVALAPVSAVLMQPQ